jgi:hypothetical protein
MAYTKLFNSIVTSTIWMEDDRTRIVWITMLACADKNGEVQASIPGLARIAGVPVEDCRAAIGRFLSPDLDSRTKDDQGRRIEEIDGGWSLLNFRKYREMASKEESQANETARKARYREGLKRNGKALECPAVVPFVPSLSTVDPHIADADADTDAKADTKAEASRAAARPVQGIGASESGSLPRDHMRHAACGPRFLICLSPAQYSKLAPRFNAGTDAANRAGVEFFLGYAEGLVGPNQSPGDFVWLLQHYDAWLAAQGRIPAAPAKLNGKPQPRTAAQIIASMKAEGSL